MQLTVIGAPPTPASERVWHPSELVILIVPHLVRERIEDTMVSQLRNLHRALALPFLIRPLDIFLSRLDAYEGLFSRSPELARYVRFVRITDDTTATKFLHRDHCRPTKAITSSSGIAHLRKGRHQPKIPYMDTAHQWLRLKDIIDSIWTELRFDLEAGVSSSSTMPASFRAHISKDGETIQPGKLRHPDITFDHLGCMRLFPCTSEAVTVPIRSNWPADVLPWPTD